MTNTKYTPNNPQFWDFSWDEMALFDLPANINYILQYTGVPTLAYAGHSEGTIQAFAGFISNHTLASRVNVYLALAPVAFVKYVRGILLQAMAKLDTDDLFELLGVEEFYPPNVIDKLLPGYCDLFPQLCAFDVDLVCGPTTFLNDSRVGYYLDYEPNPTSVKNMAHWAQGVREGTFGRFDYGAQGNLLHYNQTTPPQYDPAQYPQNLPTVLFCGEEDYLADPADVAILLQTLSITPFVHTETQYAHLDPLLGINAYSRIYPIMLQFMQRYAPVAAVP